MIPEAPINSDGVASGVNEKTQCPSAFLNPSQASPVIVSSLYRVDETKRN